MLSQKHRLAKRNDIQRVFKQGKGVKSSFLYFKAVENNLSCARFAFVVSKKISKKSTERNRIRRLLRESVRNNMVEKNYDIVIIVLPEILKIISDFKKMKLSDVEKIIKKSLKNYV